MSDSIMATYGRLPVSFSKGKGVRLWDAEGNEYIDAISGIAVCSLGHAHPILADAIADQAKQVIHTSNLYGIELQTQLADRLVDLSGLDEVFFSNSGAEANEAALKLARKYGHNKGVEKPTVMVVEGGFHGRTMAALSASGNPKIQQGFTPLLEGFIRVPYNDIDAIRTNMNNDVVAIMLETVQGEGGVHILKEGYLQTIRDICDENDCLMILDEVQTGMCRTGEWFGFQHEAIKPDVMTLAKALGNGFPVGAMLAGGKAKGVLTAGMHGSTFGGNPLACRAALTVIDSLEKEDCKNKARKMGQYFLEKFKPLTELDHVEEVRGKGMMIGIQLKNDCTSLVAKALEKRLLINVTAGNVIRLLPPLIMTHEEADIVIAGVSELVREMA